MSSLNQCQFIGNLGKDVDTRFMADGKAVANFSIACSEKWKDRETGEKKESTEWINITAFGKLAEICDKYLKKGSQVYISGKMKTEKYTDKNGIEKYSTKVIAKDMVMLGGKAEGNSEAMAASAPAQQNDDFDDPIPF